MGLLNNACKPICSWILKNSWEESEVAAKKEKASNCLKNFNECKIVTSNKLTAAFNFGFEIHLEKNKTDIKVFFHSKVQKSRNLFFLRGHHKINWPGDCSFKSSNSITSKNVLKRPTWLILVGKWKSTFRLRPEPIMMSIRGPRIGKSGSQGLHFNHLELIFCYLLSGSHFTGA